MSATKRDSDSRFLVALDVGGSSVKSGVFAPDGTLIANPITTPLNSHGPRDEILDTFANVVATHLVVVPPQVPWRLGFGFPGPFDFARGVCLIRGVEKYDALYGCDVGAELTERLDRRPEVVRFFDDAEVAVLGEVVAGAGRGLARVLGVTLGTGLGAVFLADGCAVHDGPGVPPNGWLYPLDFEGTRADDLFSARGLGARAAAAGFPGTAAWQLAELAGGGNPAALAVWAKFGTDLGTFLAPHARAFAAERVIVLGGLAAAWPFFGGGVQSRLPVPASAGLLGESSALIGIRRLVSS